MAKQLLTFHSGTMTLYEEVGLSREASPEEIRQAYHNLARLLHPDAVADPSARKLAEAQMRRINAAFEVLNDPVRRAAYDSDLSGSFTSTVAFSEDHRPVAKPVSRPLVAAVVIGVMAIGVGALLWQIRLIQQVPPAAVEDAAIPAAELPADEEVIPAAASAVTMSPELATEVRRLKRELSSSATTAAEQDTVFEEDEPEDSQEFGQSERALEPELAQPGPAVVRPQLAQVLTPRATLSPPRPTPVPAPSVFGTWLYAQRPGDAPKKDWYPPDFIELKIRPAASGLFGTYQARYRVGDLPISPEVRFHFEGKGEVLPFAGANGVKGEVRLKQTSPMTLQVDWVATTPGSVPSLTTGSSLLVKSPE